MIRIVRYKELVMALGLLPILACTIGAVFFPEAYVLYLSSAITLFFFIYQAYKRESRNSQLILFHATLSLTLCTLIKLTKMEWLLPDNSISITLEILIFCFSIFFLFFPKVYERISRTFYPKDSVLNKWACASIVAACGLHFLISSSYELFHLKQSESILFAQFQIIPVITIIVSILFNFLTVIILGENTKKQVIVRIAPIYDGKVYLMPTNIEPVEDSLLDLPISEFLSVRMKEINQCANKLCRKYSKELSQPTEPRFSLKYISKIGDKESVVLLYILPLKSEEEINFENGQFINPKEIVSKKERYNPLLVEEAEHLQTTAEMWQLFG